MSRKKRISTPSTTQGSLIKANEPTNYDTLPPIFSLERVQSGDYCFSKLSQEDKSQFAEAIFRRKSLMWRDIKKIDRHGLGFEKISKNSIKTGIPASITEDETHLLAFRYSGRKAMVGQRVNNIFYVLWFDHNFSLYNHGS